MTKKQKNKAQKANKKWNLKDFLGVLAGILIGIIVTVFAIYLNNKNTNRKDKINLDKVKPEINIEIRELSKNKLNLLIQSINKEGSIIDKLYFKFDIPGTYSHYEISHQDKIENFSLKSNLHTGHGGTTTSESITFESGTFYSPGFLELYIHYKPTQPIVQKLDYLTLIYEPVLNLHDYAPYYFYWTYNGTSKTENGDINLEYLSYIINDNLKLVSNESYVKRSIKDQIIYYPDHPISKYIKGIKISKTHKIKIPLREIGPLIDTLIIYNDSIITKSTFKGPYKDYDAVKKMEIERRTKY